MAHLSGSRSFDFPGLTTKIMDVETLHTCGVIAVPLVKTPSCPASVPYRRHKPKGVDSCFGNFPRQYKQNDGWDGNPTLRRDSRTSYTSPKRFPPKTSERKGPVSAFVTGIRECVGPSSPTEDVRERFVVDARSRDVEEDLVFL